MTISDLTTDVVDMYPNADQTALILIHTNSERTAVPIADLDLDVLRYAIPDYRNDGRTDSVMFVPGEDA